jgi:hypothetical protein
LQAQEPMYVHISEEQGIPDRIVFQIEEDQNGLIWLATTNGLFSYNGETFKQYVHSKNAGSSVFGLKFDKKGRLWYTSTRSQIFYIEDNEVVFFTDLKKEVGLQVLEFNIIDDEILVNAKTNFFRINIESKVKEKVFSQPISPSHSMIQNFKSQDYLIILNSLYTLNNNALSPPVALSEDYYNPTKQRFFCVGSKLYLRLQKNNKYVFKQIENLNINDTNVFNALSGLDINYSKKLGDAYWFLTTNGAYKYHLKDNTVVLEDHYLKGMNVTDVIIDRNQNHIFSTLDNGIFYIPDITVKFLKEQSYTKSLITAFEVINDSVVNYISDHDRLNSVNFNNGTKVSRKIDRFQEQQIYLDTIIGKSIFVNNSQLELYNPINLNILKKKLLHSQKQIVRYNENYYLSLRHNGIHFLNNNFVPEKLLEYFATEVNVNASNNFYLRSQRGIEYFEKNEATPKGVTHKGKPLLTHAIVSKTNTDKSWISRVNWGLYLIEKDKIVKAYYNDNGLLDKNITALDSDKDNLWIVSNQGIQKLSYSNDEFTNFGISDGIVQAPIHKIKLSKNYVWFQTINGIYQFPKNKKKKEIVIPDLYFSSIKIDNEPQEIKNNYELKYYANALEIEFMINGFKTLDQYQFEYKVEGLDNKWKALELGKHEISFNSLPSGSFTILVRGLNIFENIYTDSKQFHIEVNLPFWKRWWFSAFLASLIIIAVVTYYRMDSKKKETRRRKEIQKLEIKHQMVALKLENFRSQMNPHFIFNALNSIQEYIILNRKDLASDYLGKFADLIRAYLNHSTKGKITLQEEIDCLEMYLELEKLRFEDKLQYAIRISGDIAPDEIDIPTMIIQPYVENAIKHGLLHRKTDRDLKINFFINEVSKIVKCVIVDNGIGRDKAEEYKQKSNISHKSFATKANQERLNLLNQENEKDVGVTITDLYSNGQPSGTEVKITIPFKL